MFEGLLLIPALIMMLVGFGAFVCFVLVVVKMFQNDQAGLGIASIVLSLCGVGSLLAFVVGWVKSSEWQIKNLMWTWTACWLTVIVFYIGLTVFVLSSTPTTGEFKYISTRISAGGR